MLRQTWVVSSHIIQCINQNVLKQNMEARPKLLSEKKEHKKAEIEADQAPLTAPVKVFPTGGWRESPPPPHQPNMCSFPRPGKISLQ